MGTVRQPSLAANFPQMNFTQLHERVRQELLRRIQRGTLSVSLLARQTGFAQSHVSHFLRCKRQLSLEALDRVLAAQQLAIPDLMPANRKNAAFQSDDEANAVPIVSHLAALYEPLVREAEIQTMLHLPPGMLESVRAGAPSTRRAWQRFVAVRFQAGDFLPMEPLMLRGTIALLDRHYTSFAPYRPYRHNLYAVLLGAHLQLRYVDFQAGRLVLRPHNIAYPVNLIEPSSGEPVNRLVAGRVVLIVTET
jgi:transcriptional regulator with XRE-family HTH domain